MKFPPIPQNQEYHTTVNRPAHRSIPLLGAFALPLLFISAGTAQFNSANSAHTSSVAPPTAAISPRTAAIAPPTRSLAPPTSSAFTYNVFLPSTQGTTHTPHHPHPPTGTPSPWHPKPQQNANGSAYYYPYFYAVPIPYGVDVAAAGIDPSGDSDTEEEDDAEDQGGPTIFDRHGSGPDSYIPPSDPGPAHAQDSETTYSSITNESPQPPTTLVFKDGHEIEVENYAIVSQTLYDLTPGHPRRIALADLDLEATQKQNDDRGVVFQLPPQPQAN